MPTKGYRVLIGDCNMDRIPTFLLRGGRVYPTKKHAMKAAKRWESKHPRHIPVELVPTGYGYPGNNDAQGWDDLRTYGYPSPRSW